MCSLVRNHRSLVVTSLLHARNIPSGHLHPGLSPRPSSPFQEGLGTRLYPIFVLRCYHCLHNSCQISRCDSYTHTLVLRNAAIWFRFCSGISTEGQSKLLSLSGCCDANLQPCPNTAYLLFIHYPVKDSSLWTRDDHKVITWQQTYT